MRPLGDRRAQVRFDVLGTLRGTLELTETARLINISVHGALIESSAKVAVGSVQELQLTLEGRPVRVSARVRHMRPVVDPPAELTPQYIIGLEFLSPPTSLTESIAQMTGEN